MGWEIDRVDVAIIINIFKCGGRIRKKWDGDGRKKVSGCWLLVWYSRKLILSLIQPLLFNLEKFSIFLYPSALQVAHP